MADVPNVRFINLVDTPATVQYSIHGDGQIPLEPATGNVVDLTGYRRVSIRVGTNRARTCAAHMGKITGTTLAQELAVPLDGRIHSFEVAGPQLTLWLRGGAASTQENVQVWVYLRS